MFVSAVAKGRNVGVATVRNEFGEGRMVLAKDAVRRGMADRVETMQQTLARLTRRRKVDVADPCGGQTLLSPASHHRRWGQDQGIRDRLRRGAGVWIPRKQKGVST